MGCVLKFLASRYKTVKKSTEVFSHSEPLYHAQRRAIHAVESESSNWTMSVIATFCPRKNVADGAQGFENNHVLHSRRSAST